jgi:hypothetical protein
MKHVLWFGKKSLSEGWLKHISNQIFIWELSSNKQASNLVFKHSRKINFYFFEMDFLARVKELMWESVY